MAIVRHIINERARASVDDDKMMIMTMNAMLSRYLDEDDDDDDGDHDGDEDIIIVMIGCKAG